MPKYYKLTDENDRTHGDCQWGENVTYETDGKGDLCGPGWTHWYTHPLLAVLLNPSHGRFDLTTAHLWESPENQVAEKFDCGLKVGCKRGTTARRIPLPEVTLIQKIAFGILCSLAVYKEQSYVTWAESWLSGEDRSANRAAATRAAWTAEAEARAAEARAAEWAAWAAGAAEWAAWAAAAEARAAGAADALAAGAAEARAAGAAARAAALNNLDLVYLAYKAMEIK
jgi:hypothetical protein